MPVWLQILFGICTSVASLVAAVVSLYNVLQNRRESAAKLAVSQAKDRNSAFVRILTSPWIIPLISVLLGAALLRGHLRAPSPASPELMFLIALDVSQIFYGFGMFVVFMLLQMISKSGEVQSRVIDQLGKIADVQAKHIAITLERDRDVTQ